MKQTFFHYFLLAALLAIPACHDHDYYQVNPNAPSTATPALLLTGICIDVFNNDPTQPAYASRHLTYYERPNDAVNYGWATNSFGAYGTLRQVKQMEELAAASGDQNYQGLAKFFRAVLFSQLTEVFGDVPYSEAMQAEDGIVSPAYDAQEDVYVGILNELEEANALLDDANGTIGGDIIYGGKASQWKKAANAFRLRLLIHLSKKEGSGKLNIKQQLQTILNDPGKYPLMASIDDNAQITYNTSATDNYYPTFNGNSVSSLVSLEKGLVDLLKERQDPRLFSFGDPIQGMPANDFNSYNGVDAGLIISDQQNAAPMASKINRRFVNDEVNEPMIMIGFAEQEFLIAEAIARGWASGPGTASGHYNTGIRASMLFYGIGGPAIEGYLNKPLVKYDAANYLEQIITQKYIAMFMQSGWEPFYEQRRTGFPTFSVGPATLNGGQIPKRWRYPQDEYDNNGANVQAAVARQYGGDDDVNGVMWILQ
jgi:Starch-binding associating with outer membrane